MAFNNGFYPQYFQPPVYQPQQSFQQNPQNYPQNYQQNQQQMQSGGFMVVQSEEIARGYPVAPGNCVTFKIEGKPIVMEKSMGFSQLDSPRVDRYRLVREEDAQNEQNLPQNEPKEKETDNETIEELKSQIKALNDEMEELKKRLEKVEDMGA